MKKDTKVYAKYQMVKHSEITFDILGLFKKMNERIWVFCLTVLKTNLFIRFLEESEDPEKSFRKLSDL